jgi:hypothetical protein
MPASRLKKWGVGVLLGLTALGVIGLAAFAARIALRQTEDFVTFRMRKLVREELQEYEKQAARRLDLALVRRAADESAEMVNREMRGVRSYPDKFALLRASIERCDRGLKGLYCEFGVYKGETINFIASLVSGEVHGFDSFKGLPENWWGMFEKGMFSMPGLPPVRPNVRLHKGWFKDSLPRFRAQHPEVLAFAHLDADLYTSTKDVLELLGDRIVPGTVLQFDEYMNYPGWQGGEYKAFQDFVSARKVEFDYIGLSNEQVAVRITRIAPVR